MQSKDPSPVRTSPLRVLFLCTGNSARSQIAEALLQRKAGARFEVASAGTAPAPRVHPLAVEVLREYGIDWSGRRPKSIDEVSAAKHEALWDLVITVCDRAREACPALPGQPVFAHWGMPNPAAVEGDAEVTHRAFRDTLQSLSRRIDLLLALPVEALEQRALAHRLDVAEGRHQQVGDPDSPEYRG